MPGDAGSHHSQPGNKHGLSNTSAWLFMPSSFHASPPSRDFLWLSLPPEKHPSCRLFPFSRRSSSQAQGEQWDNLEQAAPLVAESFPHPRLSPNLSQPGLLWFLLSCLLSQSCPEPQPKPCSHPQHLSVGPSLTC